MEKFSLLLILWYIFPIVLLYACNFIIKTFNLQKKYRIKIPDIAIPFLFVGLNEISNLTYNISVVPFILITLVLLAVVIALFFAHYYGELQYLRYIKMCWRVTFLIASALYVLFIILSIVHFVRV